MTNDSLVPRKRAVVLLSGGLDSTTLLFQMLYEEYEVFALCVDYGQRHARELLAAQAVAKAANVKLRTAFFENALRPIFAEANSSQVGQYVDVPHGHYAAENMKTTIVPNRNMLLLAIAGAYAESIGAEAVAYAAHAGDHAIYPDCRPEFAASCAETLRLATADRVTIVRPFVKITKTDIVRRGALLKVPFELTWSCYDPQPRDAKKHANASDQTLEKVSGFIHCGLCGTCVERKEAFRDAEIEDPTEYVA